MYNNNLSIEQKIGSNQINVIGFEKRDVSDLQRYAIQKGFEYIEYDPGYQWQNSLLKNYKKENSLCTEYKRASIYDGSPYKIKYSCIGLEISSDFVYDFKSNSWYTNENRKADEKDFKYEKNHWIKLPSEEQEIFDKEFKDIHEEIKNGVENFNEE